MLCEKCMTEMRIKNSCTRPENEGGKTVFYHVNHVACVNRRCSEFGNVQEHKTALWEGRLDGGAASEAE